jgi:hypothetical protein
MSYKYHREASALNAELTRQWLSSFHKPTVNLISAVDSLYQLTESVNFSTKNDPRSASLLPATAAKDLTKAWRMVSDALQIVQDVSRKVGK